MLVAVLSDIHANLTALDAVLEAAGGVHAVWHLGDVVGYGPDPDAVVDRLATVGAKGVRGNHDAAAVGELDVTDFHADARRAMEWTRDTIATATADWLQALEPTRREGEYTLVHGSPRDPTWEYILGRDSITANLDALTTPFGLHGHTHVPIAYARSRGSLGRRPWGRPTGRRRHARPARRAGAPEPRQRRPAARRCPDRLLAGPRHRRASGDLAPDRLRHRGRPGADAPARPAAAHDRADSNWPPIGAWPARGQ